MLFAFRHPLTPTGEETPDDEVKDCCGAGVTPVRFRALSSGQETRQH